MDGVEWDVKKNSFSIEEKVFGIDEMESGETFSEKDLVVIVPIGKYNLNTVSFRIEGPVTIQKLFAYIYSFYQMEIEKLDGLKEDFCGTISSLRKRMESGEKCKNYELLGDYTQVEKLEKVSDSENIYRIYTKRV